jgi:cation transport ATPase
MMEQEEVAQESEHTVIKGEVVEEAIKDEPEDEADIQRRMKYLAIGLFVAGSLFAFAPMYLQTNILWILILSAILAGLCWIGTFLSILRAYPSIHNNQGVMMCLFVSCTFGLYVTSYFVTNQLEIRAYSFFCLLASAFHFLMCLPKFVESYKQQKDQIKALFTPKNIIAAIGVALVFVTTLLTFLQTVFQIFHR